MSEKKLGENVPFEKAKIQETAVEFENIRNEWQDIYYPTYDKE